MTNGMRIPILVSSTSVLIPSIGPLNYTLQVMLPEQTSGETWYSSGEVSPPSALQQHVVPETEQPAHLGLAQPPSPVPTPAGDPFAKLWERYLLLKQPEPDQAPLTKQELEEPEVSISRLGGPAIKLHVHASQYRARPSPAWPMWSNHGDCGLLVTVPKQSTAVLG